MEKFCSNCVYSKEVTVDTPQGPKTVLKCICSCPTVQALRGADDTVTMWPEVNPTDFCYEWRKRF